MKRLGGKVDAAIAAGAGCVLAAAFLPFACRLPNFIIPDDGYFYAEIAYRLATEGRSTFDGVHTTSGYHLPWAFVLAAISRLIAFFTRDHVVHLYGHLAVSLAIAVATARHFFQRPLFQICAFVLILSNFSLTEMVLAAPILLGILHGGRHQVWLAAALPIVRVDLACVPFAVAILTLRAERPRALALAGGTLAGILLQLATMKLAFGHFFSVSAVLKTTTSLEAIAWRTRFNLTTSGFQALFYVAHVFLGLLALHYRRERSTLILVIAAVAFIVPHTLLSMVRGWYWVPSSIAILFALEHALGAGRTTPRMPAVCVAMLAGAWLVHAIRVQVVYAADARGSVEFLADLQQLVPARERLFTSDCPGFLGFFSGRDVVDGDGLVNDYTYARRLQQRDLATYLDEEDICYVVIDYPDQNPIRVGSIVLEASAVNRLAVVRAQRPPEASFALLRRRSEQCLHR